MDIVVHTKTCEELRRLRITKLCTCGQRVVKSGA